MNDQEVIVNNKEEIEWLKLHAVKIDFVWVGQSRYKVNAYINEETLVAYKLKFGK